jgi:uncharacterized protein (DUF4415 family)
MPKARELTSALRFAKRSVAFFGNSNKAFRERWVVRALLKNLGLSFSNSQVRSSSTDPPDVLYKSAAFEVKELLDRCRKRHDEVKAHAKRVAVASDLADLLEPYSDNPRQLITIRLPADVITRWRATGAGWQTRMAERLERAT